MFTFQDLLSLAQDKMAQAQDKVSTSYDSGLTNVLNTVGLQRKLQEEPKSDTALLAGLFSAGLVTGLALSLLFAPKSGAEVRKSVRRVIPMGDDYDQDDYELMRYDLDNDRFREIRRQRRSHRARN